MKKESLCDLKSKSIYTPDSPNEKPLLRSLAWHNIGATHASLNPELSAKVAGKYSFRGGALDYSAPFIGLYIADPTKDDAKNEAVLKHAEYLGDTLNRDLFVHNIADLANLEGNDPDTLVVPYIHTPEANTHINELGQNSWGLPPEMVSILKNKATVHELIRDLKIDGLEIPDFEIATIDDVTKKAEIVLNNSKQLYKEHNLSNEYPLGVVIRVDEADGGYGTAMIFEQDDGSILVTPDGNENEQELFKKGAWSHAFKFAEKRLRVSTKKGKDTKFVVSRRIDREDSPGMSLILKSGVVESIGWNGQVLADGSNSCVGTGFYDPETPRLEDMRNEYEKSSSDSVINFMKVVADKANIPFESISGVVNFDMMIPGSHETALRLKRKMGHGIYIAESNARWTNYTDAIMMVLGIKGLIPSMENILETAEAKVHTIDAKSLRGADPEIVRTILFEIDKDAKKNGNSDRAFMRMPVAPDAGFVLTGNRNLAEKKIDTAIKIAKNKEVLLYCGI